MTITPISFSGDWALVAAAEADALKQRVPRNDTPKRTRKVEPSHHGSTNKPVTRGAPHTLCPGGVIAQEIIEPTDP